MTVARQIEEALFDAARNIADLEARRAFLDQTCHGNTALRQRLDALLASLTSANDFFNVSAPRAMLASAPAPVVKASHGAETNGSLFSDGLETRIGPYRLMQRLGEGGCGVVYMAEQEAPLRRLVALKIIRLGMDTERVVARFDLERQALALMDHPNIARVLDAGATQSGRPYFVMELVHGVRITDYCNENHLDTAGRLRLFIQVCHAIQHAHQKGLIHRDIKPSNILVTLHDGEPAPKVIDFGIAKATEGPLTDNAMLTACDQFVGTPAYMSPERAETSGLDVDTRSDIYSLGVLLYELLSGRTPFDAKQLLESGVDEIRRALRERDPAIPSTMLTTLTHTDLNLIALQRHVEGPSLISTLKGDLDWIVMKALEKDRQRRYQTANELAADVQRFLHNEPVVARPPSRVYRLQKLVRRNKVVFAAAAAVVAALLVGLGASTWLFIKERESRREAEHGRAMEAILRRQAEARERIAQAAVLVSQSHFDEADRLVDGVSFPETTSEGETVFRTLGEWAAIQSQWKRAAERLTMLQQVDHLETWDTATLDCSRCAAALLELGDTNAYDRFRRAAIQYFGGTSDPLVAERTVKNALLLPADRSVMVSLAPLAEIAANSFNKPPGPGDSWMAPWRCVSLALIDYRRGRFSDSAGWANRCIAYGEDNPPRVATARAILAMADVRLGHADDARAELALSRAMIDARFQTSLDTDGSKGFWFDWVLGRALLREAMATVEPEVKTLQTTEISAK